MKKPGASMKMEVFLTKKAFIPPPVDAEVFCLKHGKYWTGFLGGPKSSALSVQTDESREGDLNP
jgi:hypothetical protein